MKIERIQVNGFGRLRDLVLDFAPRLNVICGPNEAGKSTLLEAIQALLFGFAEDGKPQDHNRRKSYFTPWAGGQYAGTIHVSLGNGEKYRLVRDFAAETTRVLRDPGATDQTSLYSPRRHGWVSFADEHLGLSRPTFRASARIDQSDLQLGRNEVNALKDKLNNLTGSADAEMSAQAASQRLADWLRTRVNPGGYTGHTSPLRKAEDDVASLESELADARRILAGLEASAVDEQGLVSRLADLDRELLSLGTGLAWRELKELDDKLSRLDEVDDEISAADTRIHRLEDVAGLSRDALDQAATALGEAGRLRQELARAAALVDRERADRETAAREMGEIAGQVARLPAMAATSPESIGNADSSVDRWRSAAQVSKIERQAVEDAEVRLAALESDYPGLRSLPSTTTAEALDVVIRQTDSVAARQREAELEAATAAVSREIEVDYTALEAQIGELNADHLEELLEREHQIDLAEATRRSGASLPAVPVSVVAALLGLVAGWLARGIPGAVAGAAVLGAVGYVVARAIRPPTAGNENARVAKNRQILDAELARFGVSTTGDLRQRWNRRNEIAEPVRRAREWRQRVADRRQERDQVAGHLERLAGVGDTAQAHAIHTALLTRAEDRKNRTAALAVAMTRQESASCRLVETKAAADLALGRLGIAAGDPSQAANLLSDLRGWQLRRGELLRRRAEVDRDLSAYTEHEKTRGALEASLAEAKELAERRLGAAGVALPNDDWPAALERRRERFEAYQQALNDLERRQAARCTLIGSDEPSGWRERRDGLRDQARGADETDLRGRGELEQRRSEASAERDRVNGIIADLRARRNAEMTRVREPAAIEEDLAGARKHHADLTRVRSALEGARDLLTTVAEEHRRNFAPRLAAGIGDGLAQVTADRYQEVEVDPVDLTVQVKSADHGSLIGIESLSHGTRDVVCLLLRASIVGLLSGTAEPVPLFLDDPLVHVDSSRTQRLLEVINHVADERQVFYFTQDSRAIAWARACPSVAVRELIGVS